jgi:hypothetical protein
LSSQKLWGRLILQNLLAISNQLVLPKESRSASSSWLWAQLPAMITLGCLPRMVRTPTPKGARGASLTLSLDLVLKEGIETVTADDSYTILFQSTPAEPNYEASFMDINFDLRRHAESSSLRRRENGTEHNLPLFEKYQFFTPGLSDMVPLSSALYANVNGRDFHGYHRCSSYSVHSRCWSEGSVQPRGVVRSIRQGDGACRPEEAAMIC